MEKRWFIFIILTFIVVNIYSFWQKAELGKVNKAKELEALSRGDAVSQQDAPAGVEVPGSYNVQGTRLAPGPPSEGIDILEIETPSVPLPLEKAAEDIYITTNMFDITFSTRGAVPTRWEIISPELVKNGKNPETSKPITIIPQLNCSAEGWSYPFEIEIKGYPALNDLVYDFERIDSRDQTTLVFTRKEKSLEIVKTITIPYDGYLLDFSIDIKNIATHREPLNDDEGNSFALYWGTGFGDFTGFTKYDRRYLNPVFYLNEDVKAKVSKKPGTSKTIAGSPEWAGLQNTYFAALFIPEDPDQVSAIKVQTKTVILDLLREEIKKTTPPIRLALLHKKFTLEPLSTKTFSYKVFVGPKQRDTLKEYGYNLDKLLFGTLWGWVRALCLILLKALNGIYGIVGNYGVSILLLTVIVKIITHPLTHKGMKIQAAAMKEQQKIKPIIDAINEKYKNDPQAKNREVMKAYKEHGINPFAPLRGCIPMLIQFPILIGLFQLLGQMVELRGAGFLWITDLSQPDALIRFGSALPIVGWDSLNILPIIMTGVQVLVSRVSSSASSSDATQRQMMVMMPLFMLFIFYTMPSGLVLYWLTSSLWQAGHQLITNKLMQKKQKA